jgi:hypothetical protein
MFLLFVILSVAKYLDAIRYSPLHLSTVSATVISAIYAGRGNQEALQGLLRFSFGKTRKDGL